MIFLTILVISIFFGGANASSELSLDLTGYVDPEVNIERIDDNGEVMDIFSRRESRYRITSNVDKGVRINFSTQYNWRLKHETLSDQFIPFYGVFRGVNKTEIVGKESDSVEVDRSDFVDGEYEFSMIFHSNIRMKELHSGKYYGRIIISVSAAS